MGRKGFQKGDIFPANWKTTSRQKEHEEGAPSTAGGARILPPSPALAHQPSRPRAQAGSLPGPTTPALRASQPPLQRSPELTSPSLVNCSCRSLS